MNWQRWVNRHLVYLPVARIQAGPVARYLTELEASECSPVVERDERRLATLRTLLAYAKQHVSHYRETLRGVDPRDIRSLADVAQLPLLTKRELQAGSGSLRTEAPVGRLVAKTTGGSTGEPVTVYKTRAAWARELAATWRGYGWANVEIGDRQARFWGVPYQSSARWRARLIDATCNRVRLSAFRFNEENLAAYLDLLNRKRPDYFYGYVSMLREFASYLQSRGERLSFPLKSVITTSEVLTEPVRAELADAFGAPVYNEYGCGELGTIAHECDRGSLHLSEENMLVEVVADASPCAPGESGEIVVTELNNVGMPLIRYRTGDFGVIAAGRCECGRTLRSLENIHGRAYDFVIGENGRKFHGEFVLYIFEEIRRSGPGIRQFQCIQESLDGFRVRVVREEGYGDHFEELITTRLRQGVNPEAKITFEYVEFINRERSGKMRLIVGLPEVTAGGADS